MKNIEAVKEYADVLLSTCKDFSEDPKTIQMTEEINAYLKALENSTDPNLTADAAIGAISGIEKRIMLEEML